LKCGSDTALFDERRSRIDAWTQHSAPSSVACYKGAARRMVARG
jgi:hypothetical protein